MEHTYTECFGRGEIILRPVTKFTNHIDGSLGKRSEEASKRESIYRRKNLSKSNKR